MSRLDDPQTHDPAMTTSEGTMHDRLDDRTDVPAQEGGPGGWGGQTETRPADDRLADGHPGAAPAHPDAGYEQAAASEGQSRAERMSAPSAVSEPDAEETALIPRQRATDYQDRWQVLKAQFVDEPRTAVRDANELVGQVLDEIEETFRNQRTDLERDLHDDAASTEDLRLALGRYRTFFDRLLSF
ncbi:MAG: hypothetical protein ABS81_16865 [Pseudonocardia sp. SCN 72-86]|nr:MAG: hypothetical protein ABS81_16865 [Pseudonocardia sp. SCN 72-86]